MIKWKNKNIYTSIGVICTVLIIVLASLEINWTRDFHQQRAEKSLTTILKTSQQALLSWSRIEKNNVHVWSQHPEVVALTKQLLATDRTKQSLVNSPAQRSLLNILKTVIVANGYKGFFIIDHKLKNIASTRHSNIGQTSLLREQAHLLLKIWNGGTVLTLPQPSDVPLRDSSGNMHVGHPTMFSATPIRDSEKIIAILAFRIDPFEDFTKILQRGRLGDSGETYAFNNKGILVSESRFDKQLIELGLMDEHDHSILNIKIRDPGRNLSKQKGKVNINDDMPLTTAVNSAIVRLENQNLDGYRDYRGIKVIGSWLWDDELNIGITTEMDADEAYQALHHDLLIIYVSSSLTISMILILLIMFNRTKSSLENQVSQRTSELKDMAEHTQLLLDSAGEGIFGLDTHGIATFANPACSDMLGYSSHELLGQPMHQLIHHSHHDGKPRPIEISLMHKAFKEGQQQHVTDEFFWRKDGSSFPVSYTSTPIYKHNEILGAVVVFADMTEQHKVDKMKNEFVSTVSHELRTPLTSIKGSLGLIKSGKIEIPSNEYNHLLDIAENNSKRLLFLINDILDMEKLESGRMEFVFIDINLNGFIKDVIEENESYAQQHEVQLKTTSIPDKAHVLADKDRLSQVMNNLISNAAKFSPAGGDVELSIDIKKNSVFINVCDHGAGIPEEFHARLFDKFTQSDNSDTRKIGGTGLGLSISKNIVEKLQGELSFQTETGKGTCFTIKLPLYIP